MAGDEATEAAIPRARIQWGKQPEEGQEKGPNPLEQERERHRLRAGRFGMPFVDPGKTKPDMQLLAKKERLANRDPGFVTGFELLSKVPPTI